MPTSTEKHASRLPVLVTFATRGGSTREIAEQVAAVLREQSIEVDLRPAASVGDATCYSAVVLGSALYFQRLMPEAVQFLKQHAGALAGCPLVLFSVGAEMRKGSQTARSAAETWVRLSLASVAGIRPIAVAHFAGAVELHRLGFWWRLLVVITFGARGDWRNPALVRAWAATVAGMLNKPVC